MIKMKLLSMGLLCAFVFICAQQLRANDPIVSILKSELQREFEVLNKQETPVYYLDYRVEERLSWFVYSSFGSLVTSDSSKTRTFSPNMRIGSPEFDNLHVIKGDRNNIQYKSSSFPIENGEDAMKLILWKETNSFYKQVQARYQAKKNKITVDDTDKAGDFVSSEPVEFIEDRMNSTFTQAKQKKYEQIAKQVSALFLRDKAFSRGDVSINYEIKRKYFVSSENQVVVQNFPAARISIRGAIKSEEGNEMPLYKTYFSFDLENLPEVDSLLQVTSGIVDKLIEMKNAPLAEPFTGPAILSPEASGVFFHEIFGHRIEGHRLKDETDAQTFKSKVGEKVLPKTFSVIFEPQVKSYRSVDLNGFYTYDDQGVEGQKVNVVENGVLKDFLMCRTPINGFTKSNGHGRGDIRRGSVSRQSNMFITTSKPYSMADLRKKLIKTCKKEGLEYGYYFKEVTGGFTMTGRYMPNAFNVTPTEVYKVFVDGRPDELVRGVDLVGTPLAMFSTISEAGDDWGIFNGTCGAESGGVPVASVSPSILVGKVETQKKNQRFSRGTILPPPTNTDLSDNN